MPTRALNLEVRWPDGRVVSVRVSVLPLIGVRRDIEPEKRSTFHAIDADQLDPPSALEPYLARLTAAEPDGGTIDAAVFEPDLGTLLDALGVHGPPPDPIRVRLRAP